jgi:hypothetical protein
MAPAAMIFLVLMEHPAAKGVRNAGKPTGFTPSLKRIESSERKYIQNLDIF